MNEVLKDNVFYVCSMIEYVARKTKNHRKDVVSKLSKEDLAWQVEYADINHCLSFEQVSDEWIERYNIPIGTFDTVAECKYTVPRYTDIGRVYQRLVLSTMKDDDVIQAIIDVFSSFISDAISNFNASTYYCNPSYLKCSYEEGYLLD